MAFDAARSVMVLYGGVGDSLRQVHDDTWEWDGSTWSQAFPSATPGVNREPVTQMTFDPVRSETLLVTITKPLSGSGTAETWTFDGRAWRSHNTGPTLSYHDTPLLLSDPSAGRVLSLFPRNPGSSPPFPAEHDAWQWNGSVWSPLPVGGGPSRRVGSALAYDAARGEVLLFGGANHGNALDGTFDDTWLWDGQSWREHKGAPIFERRDAAVCYDSARQRVVLFGGRDRTWGYPLIPRDTHEWDGTQWITLPGGPGNRFGAAMAFDERRSRAVLFGGQVSPYYGGGGLQDTWEWDGTTWTQALPATKPPPCTTPAMAYDPVRGEIVMVCASTTWTYDGVDWSMRQPTRSPSPRPGAAMTYDPTRGAVVFAGGYGQSTFELWEWSGGDWSPRQVRGGPSTRGGAGLVFDRRRRELFLHGGEANLGTGPLGGTWRLGDHIIPADVAIGDAGCFGPVARPVTRPYGIPTLGNNGFALDVYVSGVNQTGAMLVGSAAASVSLGACVLGVDPLRSIVWPFTSNTQGFASLRLPIGATAALASVELYSQAAVLTMGTGLGVTLTNDLIVRLGH